MIHMSTVQYNATSGQQAIPLSVASWLENGQYALSTEDEYVLLLVTVLIRNTRDMK